MKVYFSSGVHSGLDATRGIGANTSEMVKALDKTAGITIVNNPSDAEVVHFTKFNPFFISIPFFKPLNQKWVLTIHDLIPLIYPKQYPSGVKGYIKYLINKFLIRKNIDAIITISETSKKDIVRFLGINPEQVFVSYIAAKSAIKKFKKGSYEKEIREKFKLPEKFILFDHGVNYNKNVPTLIEACKKLGIKLAIVGKETENIGNLDLNHAELRHLRGVDFSEVLKLGYVSDEDLNKLFNLATIYVQPSYYEGFGMPPIEAMTVGCPVICSRTQALVEVCADACLYFDPHSSDDLVQKINLMLKDKKTRESYIEKGYKLAKKYSWSKNANEISKIYYTV